MARARFITDFNWPTGKPWHIAYKAGRELTVKRECLDAALAAGAAIDLDRDEASAEEPHGTIAPEEPAPEPPPE